MIMELDFASSTPIYQQIRDQVVQAVASGIFHDGDKLPAIRTLAQEAGINTMTVNKAYQLLKQEGYLITDRRNGATIQCASQKPRALEGKMQKSLGLLAAEAKIAGFSKEEFLDLCSQAYGGDKAQNP